MKQKLTILCTAAVAAALAACGKDAAEPFTMMWIVGDDPAGQQPSILAGTLPVFGTGIQEYKLGGISGVSLCPIARGKDFRHNRKATYAVRPAVPRCSRPYRFTEMFAHPETTVDSEYARSGRPFFVYERISRPPFFLPLDGAPFADRADFAAWRKAHPGFMGFDSLWELDSDSGFLERGYDNIPDESVRRELHGAFARMAGPTGFAHRVEWAKTVFRIAADFHFGETRIWPLCSHNVGYEHIFGACGAAGLWYESTGQHRGAWSVGAAFLRGAARQRGLDYGWYMAHYRVGMDRSMKVRKGDCGISTSLHRRQILCGWLAGAKYMKTEQWQRAYIDMRGGKAAPTDYARELNAIHELALRTDRGDPFTPLAVLTPLAEPSDSDYARRNGRLLDPVSQTDVFDTLVPIRGDDGTDFPAWKKGEQGCLYNSEFGAIFDSLCPDSGQESAAFAKALSRYRYALVVSDRFDRERFDSAALAAFEKGGGRVLRYPSRECSTKESLRELLLKIQDETMPVKVEGDIMWGVNRTSKGWLLWLVNNKGVKSFIGSPEEFDAKRTAHVVATCKATGEKFTADVPPGEFRLIEISQ